MNEKDKLILESLKELLYNCESVNSTHLVIKIKELLSPKKEKKPYADEFKKTIAIDETSAQGGESK